MHDDFHILRLGYHDRANLLPLLYPIKAGWATLESPWQVEVITAPPSVLFRQLLEGKLDAAFLPPAAVTAHGAQLATLGGWGLAGEGRIETAILLAPQRIDLLDGGNVALSPDAHSSTAEHLLRVLLTPYYDTKLRLLSPGEPGYDPQGARLLFSDDAARESAGLARPWVAEDLGVAWFVLTGYPVVWEVLAVPRDLEGRKPGGSERLQALLRLSQRTAQEQQAAIIAEGASRLKMDTARVKELFNRQHYTLGETERKGLAYFLDLAAREGGMRET